MGYVQDNLLNDESVVYATRVAWGSYYKRILIVVILAPVTFGLSLLVLIDTWIVIATSEIAITNKRVIVKLGFIRRNTFEIMLSKTESIQVNQEIMGRILNYGDLVISSAGEKIPISNVKGPLEFRKNLVEMQEKNNRS